MAHPRPEPTMNFAGFFRFAGWAGRLALAIALVALAGWALDVRLLQSFYPGWVTMKANAAIGLALAASALLIHAANGLRLRRCSRFARSLGAIVALLGAATLSQYITGANLGIDQLFFSAAGDTPRSTTPGRMAAVTAVAFVLLGSALALVRLGKTPARRPAQPLAFAAGALALAAILGFMYGGISTVGSGHGIQIAFHTALALVMLAAGTLALEARDGWMPMLASQHAGGQLARRLLPLAFVVPFVLGALQSLGDRVGVETLLDGAAMVAVMTMVAFAAVIWWTARKVDEFDAQRQAIEQQRLATEARAETAREREELERTARESAERAAREKDEALTLLNLVLDSSPVGFALLDEDLRLRRVNRAFTLMTGAQADDHFMWALDRVMPEHSASVAAALRHVLATGEPVLNSERSAKAPKSGRTQHWLSSKYPVLSTDGRVIGVGMTLVETTERRELQAQLQQAQKMEAIGQLAGGVAHDFNNVLTAIRSFGELVAAALRPDSELREDVTQIITAADRGTALTRQLLAFSRQQHLEPTVLEVNSVVGGVTRLLTRLIGSDIRCETAFSATAGRVLADPGQLEQVIVNLAVNARDAMPHGGTLTIGTENVTLGRADAERLGGHGARAGEYVMLTVTDTGQGMDRETQSRIFDPFFTTKEAGKGTGLGLSTVYGIVTQSSGYISVSSEVGRGTTFRVYLPRVVTQLDAPTAPQAAAEAEASSGTVLLVDDDDAVRTVLARILRRAGYDVLVAGSPAEAERIWTTHEGKIDLLMTDLMMPEMTGDELAHRALAARRDMRVLYTSGYTDDAVMQRGYIRPEDPFLSKPFTIEAVLSTVREALSAPPSQNDIKAA